MSSAPRTGHSSAGHASACFPTKDPFRSEVCFRSPLRAASSRRPEYSPLQHQPPVAVSDELRQQHVKIHRPVCYDFAVAGRQRHVPDTIFGRGPHRPSSLKSWVSGAFRAVPVCRSTVNNLPLIGRYRLDRPARARSGCRKGRETVEVKKPQKMFPIGRQIGEFRREGNRRRRLSRERRVFARMEIGELPKQSRLPKTRNPSPLP